MAKAIPWKDSSDLTGLAPANALLRIGTRCHERTGRSPAFWQSGGMSEFSHLEPGGAARMVDVGRKPEQERRAIAAGRIVCQAQTIAALKERALPKGDALAVARIAAIQAAKVTAHLIPLCHPLPLESYRRGL